MARIGRAGWFAPVRRLQVVARAQATERALAAGDRLFAWWGEPDAGDRRRDDPLARHVFHHATFEATYAGLALVVGAIDYPESYWLFWGGLCVCVWSATTVRLVVDAEGLVVQNGGLPRRYYWADIRRLRMTPMPRLKRHTLLIELHDGRHTRAWALATTEPVRRDGDMKRLRWALTAARRQARQEPGVG